MTTDITPVSEELTALGIPHRLFRHPGPVTSLEQAAQERGQRPEQVIRSIVFRLAEGEYVMVLAPGGRQVSWPTLRRYLGQSRLTMASEDELLQVTGYPVGAVSPFGLPRREASPSGRPMRILVDAGVFAEEEVSLGSGVRGTTVILRSDDLRRALGDVEVGQFLA